MNLASEDLSEIDEIPENSSFIQALAYYYSEFLATDFKKGRLPKRRFQTKDSKGRRNGVPLSKFPSFIPQMNKILTADYGRGSSLEVRLGSHKSQLSAVTVKAIESVTSKLDLTALHARNEKSLKDFKITVKKKDIDLELEVDGFITQIRRNVGLEIAAEAIKFLQPVFEKSATNLVDALVGLEEDLADLFVSPIEEPLTSAVATLISDEDDSHMLQVLSEYFEESFAKQKLNQFFEDFSAGDFFTELRELASVEQLDDNLEFYLYLGEIRYQSHIFPIFYIPIQMNIESTKITLKIEPRVLVNKKAIDFAARLIQDATNVTKASPITNRILYLGEEDQVFNTVNGIMQDILLALDFDGELIFRSEKNSIKNAHLGLSTALSIALFDKSDESMLTDYEDLLQSIGSGSELMSFLTSLVGGFLNDNPLNIIESILDDWDGTEIPDRLVFDTPLPLAEEQRKILSALKNSDGKFVTVEGPPGTGKSHTISAVAFEAILNGQSILILSDKKEALDVVENKLNETLGKVRPSDDFVNPILRLGRTGSNFTKLTTNKSIENLRTQHREINKERSKREKLYKKVVEDLKSNIKDQIDTGAKISVEEVFDYEASLEDFCDEYKEIQDLRELFDVGNPEKTEGHLKQIRALISLRSNCIKLPKNFVKFSESFGDDALALKDAIDFIRQIGKLEKKYGLFTSLPGLTHSNVDLLPKKIKALKEAKGIFGYFFAGEKVNRIKDEIHSEFKVRLNFSAETLIVQLTNYHESATKFFDTILTKWDDCLDLIPHALVFVLSESLKSLSDGGLKTLITELENLQSAIDENRIPYLGEDETVAEILTSKDSGEAEFYEGIIELIEHKAKIEKLFEFDDYNYLARKTEFENFNALELASEIDKRVIKFATENKNDARSLSKIIRQKKKFPQDQFVLLKSAFPCMICGLRDYAEYIPLEKELFDIIIIDEASQVSIAQALPAIIRAKKMIVLGDRRQFGNVKTSNASKELNTAYFNRVKEALEEEEGEITSKLEVRVDTLNISNSILDFMEGISNFNMMLKKHFRGYPEMISFSSKYFYGNALQPMKIRGKPIEDVLEFIELPADGLIDKEENTNAPEAEYILERLLSQLDAGDHRSVAVITPFTNQQTFISKMISDHERYQEIIDKLKFRSFTFDSCQGEERDIIYYSFVATEERDKLWSIFPRSLEEQSEEELDRNKKMQRLNVGFSRGKEKLVFVHSKPIAELKSCVREVLNHYNSVLANSKEMPSEKDVDPSSPAEAKVANWLQAAPVVVKYQPEIIAQFKIGEYLKSLDEKYNHPAYRVDFLLRFQIEGEQRDIIIEYDGFEFHFDNKDEVDAGNWRHYQKEDDVERERVLESYGYKTLRINRFNLGDDPIQTLSDRVEDLLDAFADPGDALIKTVLEDTAAAHEGLKTGNFRLCRRCDQNKPFAEFEDSTTKRGYRTYCAACSKSKTHKTKKISVRASKNKTTAPKKKCPNCRKTFPLSEFIDKRNASGRRRLCGSCKAVSIRKQEEWMRRHHGRY